MLLQSSNRMILCWGDRENDEDSKCGFEYNECKQYGLCIG